MFFWGITAGGGDWGERLNYSNIRNRGISGDVSDGVMARINEIIYFKSKAVFLLIGINDLWNFSPDTPSSEYIGENIIKIAEKIKNWITKNKSIHTNDFAYFKKNLQKESKK